MLRPDGLDAVHPFQPHVLQHLDSPDAAFGIQGRHTPLAEPDGMIGPNEPGLQQGLSLGVADVPGIRDQGDRHVPLQEAIDLQQALEGKIPQ